MPAPLRTPKTQAKYVEYIKSGGLASCPLCKKHEVIQEFQYWKIIPNDFPYDRVATVHHMLIPKRHIAESELSHQEWEEFKKIKAEYIEVTYDGIYEPTTKNKSIPPHYHPHLLKLKEPFDF